MGRDIGYDGIFLELQQDQNRTLERIAAALERIADKIHPTERSFVDPSAIFPPYDQ